MTDPLKLKEIKKKLKELGAKTTGNKAELIERLSEMLKIVII